MKNQLFKDDLLHISQQQIELMTKALQEEEDKLREERENYRI